VKELGSRFAEIEKRVRALMEENSRLRSRVRELEEERGRLGASAREFETLRVKKVQVQDRLKRLLHLLEKIEVKEENVQGSERSS